MPAWRWPSKDSSRSFNDYRGWVSEAAICRLRRTLEVLPEGQTDVPGTRVAMMVDEALPIGGFVGMSASERLLQGGDSGQRHRLHSLIRALCGTS